MSTGVLVPEYLQPITVENEFREVTEGLRDLRCRRDHGHRGGVHRTEGEGRAEREPGSGTRRNYQECGVGVGDSENDRDLHTFRGGANFVASHVLRWTGDTPL